MTDFTDHMNNLRHHLASICSDEERVLVDDFMNRLKNPDLVAFALRSGDTAPDFDKRNRLSSD